MENKMTKEATGMSDAPERIWAARGLYTAHLDNRWPTPVEYVRADRIEALTARADAAEAELAKAKADARAAALRDAGYGVAEIEGDRT
jgi:hypothetical protein